MLPRTPAQSILPPKWLPVRRRKCDQIKESGVRIDSIQSKRILKMQKARRFRAEPRFNLANLYQIDPDSSRKIQHDRIGSAMCVPSSRATSRDDSRPSGPWLGCVRLALLAVAAIGAVWRYFHTEERYEDIQFGTEAERWRRAVPLVAEFHWIELVHPDSRKTPVLCLQQRDAGVKDKIELHSRRLGRPITQMRVHDDDRTE
jgi:hypothetical protein